MLICFCGYATSGKTEAAKSLAGFEIYSYADALKDEIAGEIGISRDELNANKEKYRHLLVERGAARRAENINHWVDLTAPVVQKLLSAGKKVCNDDTRYVSEIRWAKKHNARIVYIQRPGVGPANDEERISIQDVLDNKLFDSVIQNDGTIEQLHARAARLVAFYKEFER